MHDASIPRRKSCRPSVHAASPLITRLDPTWKVQYTQYRDLIKVSFFYLLVPRLLLLTRLRVSDSVPIVQIPTHCFIAMRETLPLPRPTSDTLLDLTL